jgi:hypothetical protein
MKDFFLYFFLSFFKQQTSSHHESYALRAAASKPQVEQELNDDIQLQLRALKRQKR